MTDTLKILHGWQDFADAHNLADDMTRSFGAVMCAYEGERISAKKAVNEALTHVAKFLRRDCVQRSIPLWPARRGTCRCGRAGKCPSPKASKAGVVGKAEPPSFHDSLTADFADDSDGMSDYFAAAALPTMISGDYNKQEDVDWARAAYGCYCVADAMLAARSSSPSESSVKSAVPPSTSLPPSGTRPI